MLDTKLCVGRTAEAESRFALAAESCKTIEAAGSVSCRVIVEEPGRRDGGEAWRAAEQGICQRPITANVVEEQGRVCIHTKTMTGCCVATTVAVSAPLHQDRAEGVESTREWRVRMISRSSVHLSYARSPRVSWHHQHQPALNSPPAQTPIDIHSRPSSSVHVDWPCANANFPSNPTQSLFSACPLCPYLDPGSSLQVGVRRASILGGCIAAFADPLPGRGHSDFFVVTAPPHLLPSKSDPLFSFPRLSFLFALF